MDSYPVSSNSLEHIFHIDGNLLGQQYKEHLSDYNNWDHKDHANEWILFPHNIGSHLCIDETSRSNGELYTILTNKDGKGKRGTIVAMEELTKLSMYLRFWTTEILKNSYSLEVDIYYLNHQTNGLKVKRKEQESFLNYIQISNLHTHLLIA